MAVDVVNEVTSLRHKAKETNNFKRQDRQQTNHQKEETEEEKKEKGEIGQKQQQPQQQQQQQQQQTGGEIGFVKKFIIDFLLYIIKVIILFYDLLSQPIYYFKHEVHKKQHEVDEVERSQQMSPNDPNSSWRQINLEPIHDQVNKRIDSFETYDEMMLHCFKSFGQQPCYGYRKVLEETWIKKGDSDKLFRQVKLSDFQWVTFEQFNKQIEAAKKGFILEGIKAGDTVMLYADTRPEWQIASQALIRLGAIVGTMYSTLGVDGIVHSVNETEVSHIVTQKDKVNKLLRLKSKLPKVKKIIYFEPVLELSIPELFGSSGEAANENRKAENKVDEKKLKTTVKRTWIKDFEHNEVECINFSQLLLKGFEADEKEIRKLEEQAEIDKKRDMLNNRLRKKNSIAVIMYTSGSTGIPKGVLISHGNIMATIKSFSYVTKDFVHKPQENICTAYLPLAHIFEFCIESVMLYHGVKFGFATPHTLTDKSPGLAPGQVGDLTLLKPTIMIIVPLILDRIVQGVKQALSMQSYFKEQLVTYLINYKAYWQKKHYETPLVDKIVCSKIATALGGRAKYVICGSAPLSGETQTFVRAALNIQLPQGFGTTETCAATGCQLFDDQSTCNVGLPVAGALIKLEPWIEGNYRPTDKPHPRGEIVVGGEMIAHGYYKLDEQTKEAFYTDEQGTRWYRTGDIGEFLPNGNLKIIDRKKDLVKLQNGEYISLGKVESTLKSNPYTDNFCIYANSNHNYVVALGPANEQAIRTLAQQIVDDFDRKSPSLNNRKEDHKSLLLSDTEKQDAVDEIREVLASYESDRLNNNTEAESYPQDRKMSSLSTISQGSCVNERLNKLCENRLIKERILNHFNELARERSLLSLEVPKKVLLLAEEWTEDKNLVTAAMKIRRNYIYKRYEHELAQLYSTNSSKSAIAKGGRN